MDTCGAVANGLAPNLADSQKRSSGGKEPMMPVKVVVNLVVVS